MDRVAYILEQAKEQLNEFRQFILVGAKPPVAYFAYPGKDSVLMPGDCQTPTRAIDFHCNADTLRRAVEIY